MKIALVTPARPHARSGNRHTALRWAAFLRAAGHRVTVSTEWDGGAADLMLALHARRSHASIKRFAEQYPDRRLVVALTGTDLYRDLPRSVKARESLELADRLIVLQPKAIESVPRRHRRKVRVVVQSSSTSLRHKPISRRFRICVIGHLREEKDPMRTYLALKHVPRELPIEVVHLGAALDPALAAQARAAMRREPRYRWLGSVPHARALAWLASSHALVVSSRMEGGANVVSEALRISVPVLASRISGNVGLLGERYPGYFRTGDEVALARLALRAATDKHFYRRLGGAMTRLRSLVAPASEARALLASLQVR
jgi:putative glycosyltransferase (TIGR04348 family)